MTMYKWYDILTVFETVDADFIYWCKYLGNWKSRLWTHATSVVILKRISDLRLGRSSFDQNDIPILHHIVFPLRQDLAG